MTELHIGDICTIQHLTVSTDMNGRHCEILTDLTLISVPEEDGIWREAERYGIRTLGGSVTGYMRPHNLQLVLAASDPLYASVRRAISIHLTGMEDA